MIVLSPLQTQVAPGITAPLADPTSPVRIRGSIGVFPVYVATNVCRDCMHKSTATQTYYHRMTAHLSADGRNHEPQCTMVDAAYVPAESILRD